LPWAATSTAEVAGRMSMDRADLLFLHFVK
jgi:hypothetical protein